MDTSLIEAYAAAMSSQPQMTELEVIADGIHVRLRRSIAITDVDVPVDSESITSASDKTATHSVTAQSVACLCPLSRHL